MKKLSIALLLMSSFLALAGCNKSSGGSGGSGGNGGSGGSGGGSTDDGKIQINFYADYNQIEAKNVYHTYRIENGSLLTKPADPTAPLPEFPVFLGWSSKEIIDNKADLWDFSTDKVQTDEPTFNLFGIWVAQGEQ